MKRFARLLVCALLALGATAHAQDAADVDKAKAAVEHWLSLADSGQHGATWTEANEQFQKAVSKADWEQTLRGLRGKLGPFKGRTLKSATYSNAVPGAPAGEYVLVVYSSNYAGMPGATEVVTPMRAPDGSWKVSGYFVK